MALDDTTRIDLSGQALISLAPNYRAFGRYTLVAEVGRGGMGVVWQARDNELERMVALKFLPEVVAGDPEAVRDLKRETKRCLELTHPNIVRVHDFVQDGNQAALVMEYVDGESLARRKAEAPGGCLSATELRPLMTQLCSALEYAHTKARIVHHDLKPANILLTRGGDLKVTDFGISRSLADTRTRLTNTLKSGTTGTLGYMSPQHLAGDSPTESDDIYALGAMLYELLTGKPPFGGDFASMIVQIRERTPAPLAEHRARVGCEGAEIPPTWAATALACLAKKPSSRPASAAEVAARLGLVSQVAVNWGIPPSRRRLWVGLSTAAALAGAAIVYWQHEGADARKEAVVAAAPAGGGTTAVVPVARSAPPVEPPAPVSFPASVPARVPATEVATPAPSIPVASPPPASVPVPPVPPPAAPREFNVAVLPSDAGARLWLGPQSNVVVPADGRVVVKDLPDGEHELRVQAAGFVVFTTRVSVKDGRGSAEAALVAAKGAIEITARPGTAVTAVDARGRESPLGSVSMAGLLKSENLLTVGSYALKLSHPDCAPLEVKGVDVSTDGLTKVAPRQTPLPGELRVSSAPTGADVVVNGKKLGATPVTLSGQPSESALAVEVSARGHRRSAQNITLKPRESRTINVALVAEVGGIEFRFANADIRAASVEVRIDGKKRESATTLAGSGPISIAGVEVGARAAELRHPDYEPWVQAVTVREGETLPVDVRLTPKPATLALTVEGPAAFSLKINGRETPVRDRRVTLAAGEPLLLEIAANGFKPLRQTLTLPANATQSLTFALEPAEAPKVVPPPAEVVKVTPPPAVVPKVSAPVSVAPRPAPAFDLSGGSGPKEGQPWTIPDLGLTLAPIAAGTFTMGSSSGSPDAKQLTQVTLTRPFWLGKTEVTQREWLALMEGNPSNFKGEDLPVEKVSWDGAMEYCRKLTARERTAGRLPAGYVYTLPTEAQWEYACRAGSTRDVLGLIDGNAWYTGNSGKRTRAVATRQANAWELSDMLGNVREWCADWYVDKLPGGSVTDPAGPASGTSRVVRGGSWYDAEADCRFAVRGKNRPETQFHFVGFRVALTAGAAR